MGKAGGIIGIIAGVFGIFAAAATLFMGGLGSAFETEGANTIIGLGWGGLFFSFLVVIFGAVAFGRPKGAGIGLVASSIAGAILGGTLVAIFMALSLIGGILCLAGARNQAGSEISVSEVQGAPWSNGRMVLYAIFSLAFPLIGVVGGIFGMLKAHTRRQGAALLFLAFTGILGYAFLLPHEKGHDGKPSAQASKVEPVASLPASAPQAAVDDTGPCRGLDQSITSDQIECLDRKYAIADRQLNDAYKALRANLDETGRAELKAEQIAWIKEKEKECDDAGKEFAGGTLETVTVKDCLVQKTAKRTAYLNSRNQPSSRRIP